MMLLLTRLLIVLAVVCAAGVGLALQTGRGVSDDGEITFMAYRNERLGLFTMDVRRRLMRNLHLDYQPAWTRDGRRVVYAAIEDGETGIYVMDTGTGVARRVSTAFINTFDFDWSPDGSRFAFVSNQNGDYDIYTMDADGTDARLLTGDNEGWDIEPDWSPDGERLAFVSDRDGAAGIYVITLNEGTVFRLVGDGSSPNWSPDGEHIAYTSHTDGNWDIFVVGAGCAGLPADCEARQMTRDLSSDMSPAWSPDGGRLAFVSGRDGVNYEIYAMPVDCDDCERAIQRLTFNASHSEFIDWLP
jgi:Tol biopolymer transport system component